jgi:glutathione S-transferase
MLTVYGHPISSYTWKVLIALYENDTPFEHVTIDQNTYAEFIALWPVGKFPVLRDAGRGTLVTETSVIIEYLDLYYPGRTRFLPTEPGSALEVRRWDRIFDNYVNTPIAKIVTDRLRPEGERDARGVEEARRLIRSAYTVIEPQLEGREFIAGGGFTLADCAAAPALWYGVRNAPLDRPYPRIAAYLERLKARPSFARAVKESEPLFHIYPGD